jgi:hypothetical protein
MNKYGDTGWFYMDVICDPDFTLKFSDGGSAATGIFTVTEEAGTYFTAEGQFHSKDEARATLQEPTEPLQEEPGQVPAEEQSGSGMGGVIVGVSAASLAAVGAIVLAVMKKRGKKSAV